MMRTFDPRTSKILEPQTAIKFNVFHHIDSDALACIRRLIDVSLSLEIFTYIETTFNDL